MSDWPITVHPTTEANWFNENVRTEGMLLRDLFAAQALAGIMGNESALSQARGAVAIIKDDGHQLPQEVAKRAWEIADAMLAARGQ